MQDGLISVIVPVSNNEHLDRCLDSLLSQSYDNIEILLVNCNPQEDIETFTPYTEKDERIKVFQSKKNNTASAKNMGLDNAKGEFITFVNANNFVDEGYLYTLYKNLIETRSDISICSLCRYYEMPKDVEIVYLANDESNNKKENKSATSNAENPKTSTSNLTEPEQNSVTETLSEDNPKQEVSETNLNKNLEDSQQSDNEKDSTESSEEELNLEEVNNSEDDEIYENTEDLEEDLEDESDSDYYSYDPQENNDYLLSEEDSSSEEKNIFAINKLPIKIIEKKKSRSRLVLFEGDDIFEYFFSGVEKIKTAPFAKLYRRKIFNKLRFDEDRIYEDEFISYKIYLACKKFVRTSSQLYYCDATKHPYRKAPQFVLKDLDRYYAMEERYKNFEDTKWQQQALNQMLIQIENIYCFARAGKADSNIQKFLKHKFDLYYLKNKRNRLREKLFKRSPSIFYFIKRLKTKRL